MAAVPLVAERIKQRARRLLARIRHLLVIVLLFYAYPTGNLKVSFHVYVNFYLLWVIRRSYMAKVVQPVGILRFRRHLTAC